MSSSTLPAIVGLGSRHSCSWSNELEFAAQQASLSVAPKIPDSVTWKDNVALLENRNSIAQVGIKHFWIESIEVP